MQSPEVGGETEFGVRGLRPLWACSGEEGTFPSTPQASVLAPQVQVDTP